MQRVIATIAMLGLFGALSAPSPEHAAPPAKVATTGTSISAVVTIEGADAEQAAVIDEAFGRFAAAGLELPVVTVVVDGSGSACDGNNGLFLGERRPVTIAICHVSTYVVLHELAHAWDHSALDDAARLAFMHATGTETWNDHTVAWSERGVERVANTIAMVLKGGTPSPATERLYDLLVDLLPAPSDG